MVIIRVGRWLQDHAIVVSEPPFSVLMLPEDVCLFLSSLLRLEQADTNTTEVSLNVNISAPIPNISKLNACSLLTKKIYIRTNLFFMLPEIQVLQIFYLNINQFDALNLIMSLFHASTCFEHKCSSSGGQNFTLQSLV